MSEYEFWKDLGDIFDAILHYQKKNVEFNDRFINPWIRLGNIFDRDDRNRKAVEGYTHAVDIDPLSAQNWADLGDAHFKAGSYDQAIAAYQKAVELDPKAGWPLSNLALTLAAQGRHEDAIPLYAMSIDLFADNKDKAINWNRLGNSYRKLNDYERAFQAFQKADELDRENTGFHDQLDETAEVVAEVPTEAILEQVIVEKPAEESAQPVVDEVPQPEEVTLVTVITDEVANAETVGILPNEELVATEETSPAAVADPATEEVTAQETQTVVEETVTEETLVEATGESTVVVEVVTETVPVEQVVEENHVNWLPDEPEASEPESAPIESPAWLTEELIAKAQKETIIETSTTVSEVTMDVVETYTEIVPAAKPAAKPVAEETSANESVEENVPETADQPEVKEEAVVVVEETVVAVESATEVESIPVAEESNLEAAYEQYLKDSVVNPESLSDRLDEVHAPEAKVSANGEVSIAMDTRNAHVWNELGNVYLNNGAYEDAVTAYSKAINLDRQFAWPYSNLALAYVQKGRFAEAILLYQRSIELFTSDKDKAVTWNRLGNVYRRLDDYSNAIAAYQTADELDPDNTTLSLRSHYGLLGNIYAEQKTYAA